MDCHPLECQPKAKHKMAVTNGALWCSVRALDSQLRDPGFDMDSRCIQLCIHLVFLGIPADTLDVGHPLIIQNARMQCIVTIITVV